MSTVAPPPLKLFISYSPKDARLKDELLEHLEVVRRFEGVDVWTDDRIEPGTDVNAEIEKALAQADVALLLVSPSFLASSILQDTQVPELLSRHGVQGLPVIPVIVRDCAWQEHPAIKRFVVLPRGGEPITKHRGSRRDRAFKDVATEISRLAKKRSSQPRFIPPPPPSSSGGDRETPPPSSRLEWTGQVNVWDMLGVVTNMAVDRREDDLVGRETLLHDVRAALNAKTGRGVVLYGMPGIGKTWIAQAVASSARRELLFPGGVFWVSGGTQEEFYGGLVSIGTAITKSDETPDEFRADVARRALRDPKEPTLLVIDHIDAGAAWVQAEFETYSRQTRLLVTSTHAPTGFLYGPNRAVWFRVDALDQDAAYTWVQTLAPRLRPAEIKELLAFFERHTLALDVAARTLHDDPMLPVARYLETLREGRDLGEELSMTSAGKTALSALRFQAERIAPQAQRAWAMAGCFANAPLPVGWLRASLSALGLSDSDARAGVKELVRRHLGVRVGEGAGMTLPLHPLVHIVARTLATDLERSAMAQGLVQWISGLDDPELHVKVPPAWPHIEAAWDVCGADPLVALRLAALLTFRGHREDLLRAREMLEETIIVSEQIEGPNSETVAAVCNALGCILMEFGNRRDLEEAERLLRRSLTIIDETTVSENALGRDAPSVAVRLSNLAMVLKNLGGVPRLEEAEILLRRAIDIDEQSAGPDAPSVAVRSSNLAVVLKNLGGPERLSEAETLLRRALVIQRSSLGPESPTVAVTLSQLAMVLSDMGESRLPEAERLLRRALTIRENALGLDAPRVAVTLHNLAMVLQNEGEGEQLEEAEVLLRRALEIEEMSMGSDAPKVAVTLCNLASVLKTLGGRERLSEAIEILERAGVISVHHLGPTHIQTKTIRQSIERVRRALKRMDDQMGPPSR